MVGLAYLFAFLAGLTVSGLVSSLWTLITQESPSLELLKKSDFLTPVRVLVLVFSAPTMLFSGAFSWAMERSPLSVGYLGLGLLWSFFQGVFILTSVFSLT